MTVVVVDCFFFTDTATPELYTLSLHDALPIYFRQSLRRIRKVRKVVGADHRRPGADGEEHLGDVRRERDHPLSGRRSEEHTSELQSRLHLVCRLLLEKKKYNVVISVHSSHFLS